MPMVWYVPPLSPVVDLLVDAGSRRRGPRRPVRRDRGAAHPGRVPRRAVHRRSTPTSSPRCCSKLAAMRAYMRDVTLGRDGDPAIPAAVGMTGGVAVRDVPPHGDRQVRRPLRHPHGPRRAGPRARGDRLLARLRRGAGHVRVRPVRRGQRTPGARSPSRRSTRSSSGRPPTPRSTPAESSCAAGSTCSTGTATAPRTGSSRRPATRAADGTVDEVAGARTAATTASSTRSPAWCLDYPDGRAASTGCPLLRAPWPSSRLRRSRRARRALLDHLGDHAARTPPARLRRHLRPQPQARALPVLLDRRRHPPTRRGARAVQDALPGQRLRSSTPTASCPTTCRWCSSSRRCADPDAGAALLQDVPAPASSCCGSRCARSSSPYAGVVVAVCATLPGRVAGRPRGACMAMADAGPPTESVGLEPYDPRLLPLQPAGETLMDVAAVGRAPLPRASSCWSAARSGATATTSSAGPPARRSSTSRGCCGSARRCSTSASCSCSSATSAAW